MKRKIVSTLLCAVSCCLTAFAVGCNEKNGEWEYQITKNLSGENIRVEITVAEAPDEATLLDVMNKAKENGDLSFEMAGTMVASIEGIANDIDYNPCWMLYTTDDELSNTEWGTVTMEDEVLGSAILGADTLPVEEGESYVWAYCEF